MSTFLIVDDEVSVQDIVGNFIVRRGQQILKAQTGQEAIALYAKHRPDCVLLDMKLPDISGIEVCKSIKTFNPQAKIYFITGIDDNSFKQEAEQLGSAGYLVKPIVLDDVAQIIKSISP
ncbi:MAG: response regulator [Candidatus Omnitrophota bacterium]